ECPLCSNKLSSKQTPVMDINNSLNQISKELGTSKNEIPKVRTYLDSISEEINELNNSIHLVKEQIRSVYNQNEIARNMKDQSLSQSRVIGRISLFLDSVILIDEIAELKIKQQEIEEFIKELEIEISEDEIKTRLESVNFKLNMDMTSRSKSL